MANEAQVTLNLTFTKSPIPSQTLAINGANVTVAGNNYIRNVQTVGFAAREALVLGDVGTPGYVIMHNLDTTNFVEVFPDGTGAAVVKLKAGEWSLFRLAAAAPEVKADTGACSLEYFLLPN